MERDREEEERKMRKWGGWEVERKGARRKKESEGEREGGERGRNERIGDRIDTSAAS